MSQQTYQIKGLVANDEFLSQDIAAYYERCYFSVTFFSDEYKTPVTPSAGTATITATDDGHSFGTVANGVVDVTNPEYIRPNLSGRIKKAKVLLAGVTGATHFAISINGYN